MKPLSLRPINWLRATAIIFLVLVLSSPTNRLFGQETIPVTLQNGPDSTTVFVLVGDSANIAKDVYGVEWVITADFSEMLPNEFILDLDSGWFCSGNSGSDYAWEVSGDSSSATLTIWGLDSVLCTGHGMFLELQRTGGIGQLDIADIGKSGHPISATLLHRNSSQMLVYPNPAPLGADINILGAETGTLIEVFDLQGNLLRRLEGNGRQMVLHSLEGGLYFLRKRSIETGLISDWKKLAVE